MALSLHQRLYGDVVCLHADSNPSLPGTSPITVHYHLPTKRLLQSSPKCCLYDDPKASLSPWFHLPVLMSITSPITRQTFCLHRSRRKRLPTWAESGCRWFISQDDGLRLEAWGWAGLSLAGCQGLTSAGVWRQCGVQGHLSAAR